MLPTIGFRAAVAIVTLSAMLATLPGLALAQEAHVFTGIILDPSGTPSPGFRVVLEDGRGRQFESPPTDAGGSYSLVVPTGSSYKLVRVVAPDGAVMSVQEIPPTEVLGPGVTTLSVRFRQVSPGSRRTTTNSPPSSRRWWRKPGAIVGIILGFGVAAALASQGGDDNAASPSTP